MGLFTRVEGIAAPEAADRLTRREAVVLDVRQELEWRAGHIRGALHIPLAHVGGQEGRLSRETTIVTVCRSGHRSAMAARKLRRAGYEVLNLEGGMQSWARHGLPLDPPGGRVV